MSALVTAGNIEDDLAKVARGGTGQPTLAPDAITEYSVVTDLEGRTLDQAVAGCQAEGAQRLERLRAEGSLPSDGTFSEGYAAHLSDVARLVIVIEQG